MSNVVDFEGGSGYVVPPPSPFPQDSVLYFTAAERELFWQYRRSPEGADPGYAAVSTHKVLLRSDGGKTVQLAVVGKGYHMIQNRPLYQGVEDQFIEAFTPDELRDVKVHDSMSYGGGTCLRQYIFPNVRCDIGGVSEVTFRTILKNGFGGSSIVLYTGAIDFFCTNGMLSGKYDCMYARHTKGLRIADITKRVRRSIDVFYKQADIWREWVGKRIHHDAAQAFFDDQFSQRLATKLYRQYLIEEQVHGATVWALYSAMTYYASHDEGIFETRTTGVDHSAVTLLKREEGVQRVITTDAWQRLAA